MFEDATFESMGTIHTRSRNWMFATLGLNVSLLAALIAIPLMYPSALPRMMHISLLDAPVPVEETKPVLRQEHTLAIQTQMPGAISQASSRIPRDPWISSTMEPPMSGDLTGMGGSGPGTFPGRGCDPLNCSGARTVVRQTVQAKPHISSGVMEGMLIDKFLPTYPAPARAMHIAGTVELQATISRDGKIDNLRAVNGPMLLQAAALEAVRKWRYRPYLLNGEPVEVETTINVDFTMN